MNLPGGIQPLKLQKTACNSAKEAIRQPLKSNQEHFLYKETKSTLKGWSLKVKVQPERKSGHVQLVKNLISVFAVLI